MIAGSVQRRCTQQNGLSAAAGAGTAEDVFEVLDHRRLGHPQLSGDLCIPQPVANAPQYLDLASRQVRAGKPEPTQRRIQVRFQQTQHQVIGVAERRSGPPGECEELPLVVRVREVEAGRG